MKYFYYVRHSDAIWPQASAGHPKSKLNPPKNIVGSVIELKKGEAQLSLSELMDRYPVTEVKK